MEKHEELTIEVAYASKEEQSLLSLTVPVHTTIHEAIKASGILQQFPEIDLDVMKVGVFSKVRLLTDEVFAGERIEIYRSLEINPKEARRLRAKRKK